METHVREKTASLGTTMTLRESKEKDFLRINTHLSIINTLKMGIYHDNFCTDSKEETSLQ